MRTFLLPPVLMTAALSTTHLATPSAHADDAAVTISTTDFVASDNQSWSIVQDGQTSTTATLGTVDDGSGDDGSGDGSGDDDPTFRPDELQGAWPYLAIGTLLASALVAVAVRRRRTKP